MKPTAFSFSRLKNFDECPKKFHNLSISKRYKEKESEQMLHGSAVHKALELRVKLGRPLPDYLSHLEPLCVALLRGDGVRHTELQMAVNASLEPVDWFSKDAYCRAIADLLIDAGRKALLFDYKTGKKSEEFIQLKLTAALYFQHAPDVETIKATYIWTKDRTISDPVTIERADVADIWSELSPRIDRYQLAFQKEEFPPRPGRQCKWCIVDSCPYWEGKK